MIRRLLPTALIATASVCAQETKVPEGKIELPVTAMPLCSTFRGSPVMMVDGSGNLKIIYKPTAADLAPPSLEALMGQADITVKKSPNSGTVEKTPAALPKPEPK